MDHLFSIFIFLGVIVLYIAIEFATFLIYSFIGPWEKLAKVYKHNIIYNGPSLSSNKIWFGKLQYALKIRFTEQGLGLSMIRPWCQIRHPPLFIPWSDISLKNIDNRVDFLGLGIHEWKIGKPEITTLTLLSNKLYRFKENIPQSLIEFDS